MASEEQRRTPRKALTLEVEISDGGSVITGDTLNVSTDGAFVRTTTPVDVGSRIQVRLSAPTQEQPMTVEGEVVRREDFEKDAETFTVPGIGVRFTDLAPDAQEALDLVTQEAPETRRAGPRRLPINLKVSYTSLASFASYYMSNISKGGIYLETDKILPVGTEFEFQMAVPGVPVPIKLLGEVMWVTKPGEGDAGTPPGMGIQFRYRNAMQEKMLEEIVREYLGDGFALKSAGTGGGPAGR